jgi:hypothetical protein
MSSEGHVCVVVIFSKKGNLLTTISCSQSKRELNQQSCVWMCACALVTALDVRVRQHDVSH